MRPGLRAALMRALTFVASITLLSAACVSAGRSVPHVAGDLADAGDAAAAKALCDSVKHVWLQRIVDSYRPDWSGDVQLLPAYPNPVDGGLSHAGPWEHLQHVPLLLWGPAYVRPGRYMAPTSLTDIAPTTAALLRFGYRAPDGRALTQGLLPGAQRPLPKLIVTLVWDSAGRDVLDEHPDSWPVLRSMIHTGAWFENTTVGLENSNTPPGHAAIGTGAFAPTSGITDELIRINDQVIFAQSLGPGALLWPTLGDLYDEAMGNRPLVGLIASLSGHAYMASHGSFWHGGDRDLAVFREPANPQTGGEESVSWTLPPPVRPYFQFPAYANDVADIQTYNDELDARDGTVDGKWRTHEIAGLEQGFSTPARTPYETALIEQVIAREGFGKDDVPDLLFLNYKTIDNTGHAFGLTSPEMEDSVVYQDEALRQLVRYLNREVGEDRWVMILTADHGAQYKAQDIGGIPIDPNRTRAMIDERFNADDDGIDLIQGLRPTQVWLDPVELADNGFTTDDVAAFVRTLTAAQVARTDFPLSPDQEDDLMYQTAFPSRLLDALPCTTSRAGA